MQSCDAPRRCQRCQQAWCKQCPWVMPPQLDHRHPAVADISLQHNSLIMGRCNHSRLHALAKVLIVCGMNSALPGGLVLSATLRTPDVELLGMTQDSVIPEFDMPTWRVAVSAVALLRRAHSHCVHRWQGLPEQRLARPIGSN